VWLGVEIDEGRCVLIAASKVEKSGSRVVLEKWRRSVGEED
jgi:hypothetical protein